MATGSGDSNDRLINGSFEPVEVAESEVRKMDLSGRSLVLKGSLVPVPALFETPSLSETLF